MQSNNDQMHPDDLRNLILFAVLSIAIWMGYDMLVVQPQTEALKQRRAIEAQVKQAELENPSLEKALENLSRPEILAKAERIQIDNGQIFGTLSLKGARLDDLALHKYYETLEREKNVIILSPAGSESPRYFDFGWVANDKNIVLPGPNTIWKSSGKKLGKNSPITLSWDNGQGLKFERQLSIDENYMIEVTQRVINQTGQPITLFPYGLTNQTGIPKDTQRSWVLFEGPIGFINQKLAEHGYKDLQKEGQITIQGSDGWIGITEKYWFTSLVPPKAQSIKYRFNHIPNIAEPKRSKYQVDFTGGGVTIPAGSSSNITSYVFAGAKQVLVLEDYAEKLGIPRFDLAVDFGWLFFMTKPFFYILHWLGEHIGNLGIAIIILTIIIRSAVFPLTNLSYKSFAKMKKVAPQIMELRKTHGDDKQALQKDIMALYQREGVNPMAGCFPILIQIPIFFALYKVLFTTIEVRHAPFFGWIDDLSAPDPTSLFNLFGLIPFDLPGFLQIGVWPCAMLLIMLIQKQLNPPPQDKIQRDMMRIFPFVITFVLAQFASGLVIYWTFSALISVLQQIIIMRSLDVPIHLFGETKEEKEMDKALDDGPDVHPLAEMAEDEVEHALGIDDEEPKEISPPKKKRKSKKKK